MHTRKWKTCLSGAVAALAVMMVSAPVRAESSAAPIKLAAASAQSALEIEEVIVTARRKEENLQSVPVSVTAISGQALAERGLTNLTVLQQAVPSLRVQSSDINPRMFLVGIRGLKSQSYAAMEDSVVGTYFAEVVQAHPYGFGATLYDLQSVQVLKGPQGTLFGRNHTGGAVLVEPNKASISDGFNGYATVGMGNYNMREFEGMVNVPINDISAVRIVYRGLTRDGYTRNALTGQDFDSSDEKSFRLSYLIKPTANLSSHTILDTLIDNSGPSVGKLVAFLPGASAGNIALYQPVINLENALGPRQIAHISGTGLGGMLNTSGSTGNDIQAPAQCRLHQGALSSGVCRKNQLPIEQVVSRGLVNNTAWTLGNGIILKNILGYRKVSHYIDSATLTTPSSTNPASGAIGIQGIQLNVQNQLSEEFQLSGKALEDRLDWIAGYFWFRERYIEDAPSMIFSNATFNRTRSYGANKAQALFAQGTYALNDQWKVTLGMRHNKDDRFNDNITRNGFNPDTGIPAACQFRDAAGNLFTASMSCHLYAQKVWTANTWSFDINYKMNEGSMAYLSVRKGYKSGGMARNTALAGQAIYNPEFDRTTELGVKSDMHWGDMPVRLNAAIYQSKITDLQVGNSFTPNGGLTFFTFTNNAAKASVNGVEIEMTMRPTDRLTLGGGVSYTDAKYDDYPILASSAVPAAGIAVGSPINLKDTPFGGQQIPAKVQGDLNAQYRIPLEGRGELRLNGELTFRSKTPTDNAKWFAKFGGNFGIQSPEPGRGILNLRADWDHFMGKPITVSAFVNNATDKVYTDGSVSVAGLYGVHYAPPRMFGLQLNYKFGDDFKPRD